jgi:PAS domain S-box-containing protein
MGLNGNLLMFSDIMNQLNIYIFCKDRSGKFIFCNDKFAEAAGLDSDYQIAGKTDEDLVWKAQAHVFQQGDLRTMQGQAFINVQEVMIQCSKVADILVSKNKLLNKNDECIGVIGSFIDITGYRLFRKSGHYDEKHKRFYLGAALNNEYLTAQEYKIFKKVLLGHTSEQIAHQLHLSRRTIEGHIQSLKSKLQCQTKGQIIEFAIRAGLSHILD